MGVFVFLFFIPPIPPTSTTVMKLFNLARLKSHAGFPLWKTDGYDFKVRRTRVFRRTWTAESSMELLESPNIRGGGLSRRAEPLSDGPRRAVHGKHVRQREGRSQGRGSRSTKEINSMAPFLSLDLNPEDLQTTAVVWNSFFFIISRWFLLVTFCNFQAGGVKGELPHIFNCVWKEVFNKVPSRKIGPCVCVGFFFF